ncbi:hypothetical protein O181_063089 [Austropuccinia psidii MF-1]|uniref:TATA-binding protein interacting (TIP20) domain-containing protein n=1 Tax=Austropuccinia psidii MF-1 TaxID=1389203 RepID=A0A9Q3I274_9BASI|nr:hypothetical protein [Austropuccinia psidii MF-1]
MSSSLYTIKHLLSKMRNPDADFRFMALTDLIQEFNSKSHLTTPERPIGLDDLTEKEIVDLVLELVQDKNTEVKNQAVKTLGVLVRSVSDSRMTKIIDKLLLYASNDDEQLRDLACLALRTVVTEIPSNSKLAPTLCHKLTPKLITHLQDLSCQSDTLIGHLDVLSDLLIRFETYFRSNTSIQSQGLKALLPILTNPRSAISKRAVTALGALAGCCTDDIFFALVSKTLIPCLRSSEPLRLKNSIFLAGVLARTSSNRLATTLSELVPLIVSVSQNDDDELRETSLQTLESLLLKCPNEMSNFVALLINVATNAIKYDPNYAGLDDDMELDENHSEDDQDEDDAEFGDEYSDDDDMSWKIRRAATKLLSTLIATRFELFQEFYQSVSPVLISRFDEREESVKLEIWATFTLLLKQTKIFLGSDDHSHTENLLKRKRLVMEEQRTDGPLGLLHSQAPYLSKSIIRCLNCKSIAVRQSGFILLYELINVLDGGLETQILHLLARIEAALKTTDTSVSGTATSLKIQVFKFLTLFFQTHHPRSFTPELPRLIKLIISGINDKYHRIAREAFIAASSLIKVLKPLTPTSPTPANFVNALKAIYDVTIGRLTSSNADQEVKERAAICFEDLIIHAADQFEADFGTSLPIITQRLDNEITRCSALNVVTQIARSSTPKGEVFDKWLCDIIPKVAAFLRKNNRTLKISSFECLDTLLRRSNTKLQPQTIQTLVSDLHPLIDMMDLQLLPLALKTLTLLIPISSNLLPENKTVLLEPVFKIIKSSSISQGPALDALISLFFTSVQSKLDSPQALIEILTGCVEKNINLEQVKAAVFIRTRGSVSSNSSSGLQPYFTVSRCIGAIIRAKPSVGQHMLDTFTADLENSSDTKTSTFFSLLCIGEIGRIVCFYMGLPSPYLKFVSPRFKNINCNAT